MFRPRSQSSGDFVEVEDPMCTERKDLFLERDMDNNLDFFALKITS